MRNRLALSKVEREILDAVVTDGDIPEHLRDREALGRLFGAGLISRVGGYYYATQRGRDVLERVA